MLLKLSRTKIWSTPYFSHAISLIAFILHNSCPTSSIFWLESPTRSWNRDYVDWPLPPRPVLEKFKNLDKETFRSSFISGLPASSVTDMPVYHKSNKLSPPTWLTDYTRIWPDKNKTLWSICFFSKNPLLFLIGTQRLSKHSLFNPYSVTSGKYKYQNVTNREAGGELNFPAICLRLSKWALLGREHSLPTSGPVRQEALDAAGPSCVPCSNCINQTLELPGYEASNKHCVFMCFALSNSMDQRDQNFDISPPPPGCHS